MPGKNFAIVVASLRARVGKTLVSRLIADHFILAGETPRLFDTDALEHRLADLFPGLTTVIDLDRVPDQMRFFDTLSAGPPETQVVDVTHRSFQKFFRLMRDTDYTAEARSRGIEPIIFYLPARDAESFEQGRLLRDYFERCSFVLVENLFLGEFGREARRGGGYEQLRSHRLRMTLPKLDPFLVGAMEDPSLSLSELMRLARAGEARPPLPPAKMAMAYLSRETGAGIAAWLRQVFKELKRVFDEVEARPPVLDDDPFRP